MYLTDPHVLMALFELFDGDQTGTIPDFAGSGFSFDQAPVGDPNMGTRASVTGPPGITGGHQPNEPAGSTKSGIAPQFLTNMQTEPARPTTPLLEPPLGAAPGHTLQDPLELVRRLLTQSKGGLQP